MTLDHTVQLAVETPNDPPHPDMVWIPGGTFRMGSEDFYPEESPVHEITLDGFLMDRYLVTNEQFARFADGTGYVTLAERPLNPADFPGAQVGGAPASDDRHRDEPHRDSLHRTKRRDPLKKRRGEAVWMCGSQSEAGGQPDKSRAWIIPPR